MAKGIIEAGICGFTTTVTATDKDGMNIALEIESECGAFKDLGKELQEVNGMTVCFGKVGEGPVYEACRKTCKHAACPVPMGIVKTVEVAAGMALPKEVKVTLEK